MQIDSDISDVLLLEIHLSSHRSNGLFILTIDLQYNAPSEIIPTWNLRMTWQFVLKFQQTTYTLSRWRKRNEKKRNVGYRVSLCLFFLGSPKCNAHALRFAVTSWELDNWEEMPEPASDIPRWPLDQSEYSCSVVIVEWFAFLNKRPQRGRDVHCGNEVGTLRRDMEI